MTSANPSFRERLSYWWERRPGNRVPTPGKISEPPLRAELFSADQMEGHGKTLADLHKLHATHGPDQLLNRLGENEGVLLGSYGLLREAVQGNQRITPAGEWLLDNFYLIEEQIRTARRHFPKGYSRELPILANGPSAGLPRVYDIALEVIAHGDGRINPENLSRFVAAYQKVADLKLGELWAVPIMLRLALIENLRRVGALVSADMINRSTADTWADQMIKVDESDPKSLILVIADLARATPPLVNSFVAELARRLRGHNAALALPLTWIEQRLAESGTTIEKLVQSDTQNQAANQVSISNSIGSLRLIGAMDWREFVETMSKVEQKLREDPDGTYPAMDFATRDRYRHVVERLAKQCPLSECEVARKAIQLAHRATGSGQAHQQHVGYYLIDKGLATLSQAVEARASGKDLLHRFGKGYPLSLYLGTITLLSGLFAALLWSQARPAALNQWLMLLILAPALFASSQLAVSLVNWLVTLMVKPRPLPRMDFSKGIAPGSRTLVVVPTLLTSPEGVSDLAEALEVRFLANRDPLLHFALLTDFRDAPSPTLPEDDALLQLAQARITALNQKYSPAAANLFFLLHRPRRWNIQEKVWMGYERKRGKLSDLNSLLRQGDTAAFSLIVGATECLSQVKFVITLDTDTQLPRDAARAFAGTMAHPLNRPRYDPDQQRITAGYGILQPRMAVCLPSTNRSRYAQLCGSEPGIDPYTRAVSDVYQDLFDEGSFIGKGIYEVETFEELLKDRFPENRILSHDLLEGCYVRAGLLSDVLLYEDYPARYSADVSRRYRWIRGDWQIANWLLPKVPGPGGTGLSNPLSPLSQWKLLDNLRRSLIPAALIALLVYGWFLVPDVLPWTLAVIGILYLPALVSTGFNLAKRPKEVPREHHLLVVLAAATRQLSQATLSLACLPYEAFFSLDAILRTTFRLLISHKGLLEWNASGELQQAFDARRKRHPDPGGWSDLIHTWLTMSPAPLLAIFCLGGLLATRPLALLIAAPVLLLWLLAPTLAWWISRPLSPQQARLEPRQREFLYLLSRKTWAFFETFVTARDHWLPPDNFQEHPAMALAHRTSPTNMGLSLLANLAALDFGYLSVGALLQRTGQTLGTMGSLERYRGHFYNWYDTQALSPLPPRYVSSVDSGNLSGHLMTLRPGLLALADQPVLGPRTFHGLADTMAALMEAGGSGTAPEIARLQRNIEAAEDARPATLSAARCWLEKLVAGAQTLTPPGSDAADIPTPQDATWWVQAILRQSRDALEELTHFMPWIGLAADHPALAQLPGYRDIPSLRQLAELNADPSPDPGQGPAAPEILALMALSRQRARERMALIKTLAHEAGELALVDYEFLYDESRHLLTVGYNVEQRRCDTGSYDLLASEARLSSFVAIAQGALPQESWFALGRLLTSAGGEPILLSWSGSMFEYLMPLLVMPTYENTLLYQTCRAAVKRQIAYGKQRGVPWGISESGYNAVDTRLNYQYRAFGVPGLGLKRGLGEDLVIAPYATALALMVMPRAACENLQRLDGEGLQGAFGLYEAIDYTPTRLPRGQSSAVVRSFMAHHQGMSLLALAYVLLDRPMQRRFNADPLFQATALLLQERIPAVATYHAHTAELSDGHSAANGPEMPMRVLSRPDTPSPEVQLLSNGRYHVMVSNAGGGYSRWKDMAITRWQEDGTRDNWGSFCYLRDTASGQFWSTAHQPTLKQADAYEAIFSEARAEFRRRDHDYETHTEIVVSPEDDIELRRVRITNRARTRRTIEITSYAEVVLTSPAADGLHPAFNKLFVQTEIIPQRQALLCTRHPRTEGEPSPWMFHLMAVHGAPWEAVSYETDRSGFIGRKRTLEFPQAMASEGALPNTQGSVLDPVVAIRYRIVLESEQSAAIDIVTGVGENREAALALVDKYRDRNLADRVFDLAWTHSWVNLQQINASESDAQLYGRLAGTVIYANPLLRAEACVLAGNRRSQSGLWGYAISGDLPIVLLQIGDQANIELVRQMVQAHAYWRIKGLAVDLVIWNEDHAGYRQMLQEQIMGLIAAGIEANLTDRPGGIYVRAAEQISSEDRILFQTAARAIITDTRGSLLEQLNRQVAREAAFPLAPRLIPVRMPKTLHRALAPSPPPDLQCFNGHGGFSRDGREYIITTAPGQATPAPWVNVIANSQFGTVVSESGAAYTWSENAHEFRLTPWSNDPVSDTSGEAIYLRDEETGQFWSPTPALANSTTPYLTRHGFGYSIFEHEEEGVDSTLTVFVDTQSALKFSLLKISNHSGRLRQLSATGYVEWVLGDLRAKSAMHVISEIDPGSGALYAHNPYSLEFADRIAFFDADDATLAPGVSVSGSRREFLGRNGTLGNPAAMGRKNLSNKVCAGQDPCAAIQVPFELGVGETREIIFRLGTRGRRDSDTGCLIQRARGAATAHQSLKAVHAYWRQTLGAVQVETPDNSLNLLANGWLVYQTLACRLWARSGFYQSGGAFGFRDQLQDCMALVHADPVHLRQHLLRSAARQFIEGDVQHWWHPPAGRGVRTRCSDDLLWLPQAVCRYTRHTGDSGVLDECVPYLEGRQINPEDESYYDLPTRSASHASLYQHCVAAITRSLKFGPHGLPLMGSGDWNDGMNLVGATGKGESVWLGFFLYDTLLRFSHLARAREDHGFADRCHAEADQLRRHLEQHGWDGEWYRRAYFDDGTPLGSADNVECQIDSIAQSWAVLSGAGDGVRVRSAMEAVDRRLVDRDHGLVQLLAPPFSQSALNPGYIKGYLPGIRENGGQYTHAAIWAAMAFANLGNARQAWELLEMINPIQHGDSAATIATYKVEPYVVAADVYALAPHAGRGGWTWYTGSAGWMYRLILESLLGLQVEGQQLSLKPCLPAQWRGFTLHYRYRSSTYHITVTTADQPASLTLDGSPCSTPFIPLMDDGLEHQVVHPIHGGQA